MTQYREVTFKLATHELNQIAYVLNSDLITSDSVKEHIQYWNAITIVCVLNCHGDRECHNHLIYLNGMLVAKRLVSSMLIQPTNKQHQICLEQFTFHVFLFDCQFISQTSALNYMALFISCSFIKSISVNEAMFLKDKTICLLLKVNVFIDKSIT